MPLADIETIVVVMMENRSFDHMLGYLSLPGAKAPMPVEGLRNDPVWLASKTNYQNGDPYPIHPLAASVQDIPDPPHDLNAIATQIGTPPFPGSPDGLGGFAASYAKADPAPADLSPVMGYYPADAVPVFDFFARNFAVCDHWFSALPTGTQANRLMAMSGESAISDNASFLLPDQPLVYDWLNGRKIGWCAYQSGDFLPFFALMPRWLPTIIGSLAAAEFGSSKPFRRYEHFAGDWAGSGPLPPVIFIEPEYTDGPHVDANDDHPPTGIAKGQAWLSDIYTTLLSNPARWENTLMIVTYDEHGGFFDHVPPPPIPTVAGGHRFDTAGIRVPAFLISPHVKPGTVVSDILDHTSILQLLAERFDGGNDYSPAVAARNAKLGRIAKALDNAEPHADWAPQLLAPPPLIVASGPIRSGLGGSAGASANAEAFDAAAMKAARDHPILISQPGWAKLAEYVGQTVFIA